MQDRLFYCTCFGFIFGVLLRSFVLVSFYTASLVGIISFFLILILSLISKDKWGIIFLSFLFAFSLGIARYDIAEKPAPEVFESHLEQKVSLAGEVVDEPDQRENNQKLTILTKTGGEETKILVTVDQGGDYAYGDSVTLIGKLEKPENFTTDQGKEFDYINYLRKDGILYLMSYADVRVVSRGGGNIVKRLLFSFKEKFVEKMNFVIPEPESLLMGGLILGEKSSFDEALRQSFVNTGTIHIVALSGYNVTIVAEWIMKLFSSLPQNFAVGMGVLSIILFILMTGGSTTAIRAGIMATLALIARTTERNYDIGRALLFAGVIMVLFNPLILVYDVSFQLSFIATVAVVYLSPKFEKYFQWVTKRFELRDIISVTCAAYFFVLPFILYKMGNLSLVALPANILILPIIPFTMLLGFITGFVGLISYFLSVPIGYVSYIFLHYELGVIQIFSNLPFASFTVPDFSLVLTVGIYLYFIYRLFGRSIKKFFKLDEKLNLA